MNKKRILIVEDEVISAMLLKTILEKKHEIVGIAKDYTKAVETALCNEIDFIFMDIKLQGKLTGIDAMKMISTKKIIPHVYCTAYTDNETLKEANKTEPMGIINKPVQISIILNLLNSF
jgi:two-component system, response regulator PdtaR